MIDYFKLLHLGPLKQIFVKNKGLIPKRSQFFLDSLLDTKLLIWYLG